MVSCSTAPHTPIDELDIYDHAEICVQLLNEFCQIKGRMGELVQFGCGDVDLTEQVKEILIQHSSPS